MTNNSTAQSYTPGKLDAEDLLPPLPRLDADSRPYWEAAARGELIIQRCSECDTARFYPRLLCPKCWSDHCRWTQASGKGTIYSYSVVHRAPSPAFRNSVPYVVALVDLDEDVRVFTKIHGDRRRVHIGAPVEVCFHRVTESISLPEFVLCQGDADMTESLVTIVGSN
jgi:uncharacterized OB-fold protein